MDVSRAGDGAVDSVFVALADPTRRQLLRLLGVGGELTATTLAERLPVSRQAVVKHLTVLDDAGLVSRSRVGREVRYSVRPAALEATARWMAALAVDWDRRLAAIKRVAEAADPDHLPETDPRRNVDPAASATGAGDADGENDDNAKDRNA